MTNDGAEKIIDLLGKINKSNIDLMTEAYKHNVKSFQDIYDANFERWKEIMKYIDDRDKGLHK